MPHRKDLAETEEVRAKRAETRSYKSVSTAVMGTAIMWMILFPAKGFDDATREQITRLALILGMCNQVVYLHTLGEPLSMVESLPRYLYFVTDNIVRLLVLVAARTLLSTIDINFQSITEMPTTLALMASFAGVFIFDVLFIAIR